MSLFGSRRRPIDFDPCAAAGDGIDPAYLQALRDQAAADAIGNVRGRATQMTAGRHSAGGD